MAPQCLYEMVIANKYIERRRPLRPKFFNKSDHRIGRQAFENRTGELLNDLRFDWANGLSDDLIRIKLKEHLNMVVN